MPIYEYYCVDEENCGHITEELLSLKEYEETKDSKTCPECKSHLKRSVTPLHFRLVGGNWHRDGYSSRFHYEHDAALRENDYHKKREDKMIRHEQKIESEV